MLCSRFFNRLNSVADYDVYTQNTSTLNMLAKEFLRKFDITVKTLHQRKYRKTNASRVSLTSEFQNSNIPSNGYELEYDSHDE